MLAAMQSGADVRRAIADRLRAGDVVHGVGHPLYPQGDPRAIALIELLAERYARSAEFRYVRRFAAAATAATGERPNLDFALASVSRVLRLPGGAPLTLFAIGRSIGWIGTPSSSTPLLSSLARAPGRTLAWCPSRFRRPVHGIRLCLEPRSVSRRAADPVWRRGTGDRRRGPPNSVMPRRIARGSARRPGSRQGVQLVDKRSQSPGVIGKHQPHRRRHESNRPPPGTHHLQRAWCAVIEEVEEQCALECGR